MVNFYQGFVPHAAELACPLYQALVGIARSKTLQWTDLMSKAFDDTKESLARATMLHHPIKDAPIAVTSDTTSTNLNIEDTESSKAKN